MNCVENKRGYPGVQKSNEVVKVVFVGGHRASTERQKEEKVLRSKKIEKARTQSERQKGEKVPQNIS